MRQPTPGNHHGRRIICSPIAIGATPAHQSQIMEYAAAELMEELTRIEGLLREATRRAGHGCGPDFERKLDACVRSLRPMLGEDDLTAATDAIEAAKRAMGAAARAAACDDSCSTTRSRPSALARYSAMSALRSSRSARVPCSGATARPTEIVAASSSTDPMRARNVRARSRSNVTRSVATSIDVSGINRTNSSPP